jgi:hypothetical protein
LPHRNRIFVKIWAPQKYLVQELAHQCDVQNCLSNKISSTFGSNSVVPIIKTDFKCSCDNKVWHSDLMYFSELWHKEAVKRFLVAIFRTLALQEMVTRFLVAVQRSYTLPRHV